MYTVRFFSFVRGFCLKIFRAPRVNAFIIYFTKMSQAKIICLRQVYFICTQFEINGIVLYTCACKTGKVNKYLPKLKGCIDLDRYCFRLLCLRYIANQIVGVTSRLKRRKETTKGESERCDCFILTSSA